MNLVHLNESEPICEPVTKFGGRPTWIAGAPWPLSRSTGQPMHFICQVKLEGNLRIGGHEMAYIFMTDGEEYIQGTWEAGENAVILQPGLFEPIVLTAAISEGPTLFKMVDGPTGNRLVPRNVEYSVRLEELPDELIDTDEYRLQTHVGGSPGWLQNDDTPPGAQALVIQIDSNDAHYAVNFGDAGVAYAFICDSGRTAKFLWQCC